MTAFVSAVTPPLYQLGRSAEMEADFANHLGIGLDIRETDDPQEGWRLVRDQIESGRPPMVWADIGHLDYLRVRMHNTRHDIVVVDYDEQAGVAWIADNDRDELQLCALDSLARAPQSGGFPGANRPRTNIKDWPPRLREPVGAAVRAAVTRAVENMNADPSVLGARSGSAGLDGVDHFARTYIDWPKRFGEELPAALSALRVFIAKAGTGGAMFRSLHATFLREAADLLGDRVLGALAQTYDDLASAWRALAETAEAQEHDAGLYTVAAIRSLERLGVAQMTAWLERDR
jgi:hypothetical protein